MLNEICLSVLLKELVFVLMLFLAFGCDKRLEQCLEKSTREKELSDLISRIPKELEGLSTSLDFATNLTAKIDSLPDLGKRKDWYKKALNGIFKIDISHLPYSQQYRCIRMFTSYRCKFSDGLSQYECNHVDIWRRRINNLSWKRRQWERLRQDYEREKKAANVIPVPESVFKKVKGLQYIVEEGLELDYYADETFYEQCWWSNKERMSSEEQEIVKREFEAFLRRPIRTIEQTYEDHRRRTEARRKRDEARAKKNAGRVILLDGTK